MKQKCCVVIPIYKQYDRLSQFEKKSLSNTVQKMKNWPIIVICPNSLDIESYKDFERIIFLSYDDFFFKSVSHYNELMLSPFFYESLKDYDYMLLVQLDAWIFEDKLEYFINLDYDYVGGLHYIPHVNGKMVNGNGGFCLRKVDAFIEASRNIKKDLSNKQDWEDILYSYWYKDKLNIAPDEISLKFGWQQDPQLNYEKNDRKLPFGCHKPHIFGKNFKEYNFILN